MAIGFEYFIIISFIFDMVDTKYYNSYEPHDKETSQKCRAVDLNVFSGFYFSLNSLDTQ